MTDIPNSLPELHRWRDAIDRAIAKTEERRIGTTHNLYSCILLQNSFAQLHKGHMGEISELLHAYYKCVTQDVYPSLWKDHLHAYRIQYVNGNAYLAFDSFFSKSFNDPNAARVKALRLFKLVVDAKINRTKE
jgi:hypothetical protein